MAAENRLADIESAKLPKNDDLIKIWKEFKAVEKEANETWERLCAAMDKARSLESL